LDAKENIYKKWLNMAKPTSETPEGVFSMLDTDLYKLTMQCAVLKYFPETGNNFCLNTYAHCSDKPRS